MALSLLEGNLAICSASHKAATLDVYKSKTSNLIVAGGENKCTHVDF